MLQFKCIFQCFLNNLFSWVIYIDFSFLCYFFSSSPFSFSVVWLQIACVLISLWKFLKIFSWKVHFEIKARTFPFSFFFSPFSRGAARLRAVSIYFDNSLPPFVPSSSFSPSQLCCCRNSSSMRLLSFPCQLDMSCFLRHVDSSSSRGTLWKRFRKRQRMLGKVCAHVGISKNKNCSRGIGI